jgi:aryl-alcohol dehydrogenase-like predicted oxidoreductase
MQHMRTKQLGSEGPEISVVGYGSWEAGGTGWGPNPSDDQVIEAIHAGIQAGINWVDTAEIYGRGKSEELVGRALVDKPDTMIFTKVAPEPSGTGFSRDKVRVAAEKSLERLQRGHIDLFQLHWPTDEVPIEETWEAMAALKQEGIVRFIGVSNFDRELIERCEKVAHVDSLQPHFSLLHTKGRNDLFPFCKQNGTGIICYGPLAYGLLTGAVTAETKFTDDDWRSGKNKMQGYYDQFYAPGIFEKNLAIVEQLRPIADRLNIGLAQLALAWIVHQEGATGAIAGSRQPHHVEENAAAGSISLDVKDLDEIDSILSAQ